MTTAQAERIEELEQRVKDFHNVDLAEVLDIIDYLRDGGDSVLVGGSLAYGLGNHESDLDIVVAGPATDESSSRMPLEHFIKSLRVDVWKLHQNEIDELFQRAQRCLDAEGPLLGVFGHVFEQADLKLLHRVAYGVVVDGQALVPTVTGDYRELARDLLVREYAERMRQSLFVAQLAFAAGQPRLATISARFGVEDALQASIAWRGLPFSDNKWLQVRLDRDVPDLCEIYRPFAVLPEDPDATASFVHGAVAEAERLVGRELGADALTGDASWELGDVQLYQAGELQLLVSSQQDVAFELDDEEAAAWKALGEERPWPASKCSDAQAKLCFALYSQGMVELKWFRGVPLSELELEREN
jgi:Nucleotidyltransferase domain